MKILITGAAGNIGRNLTPYLAQQHTVIATDIDINKLDELFGTNNNITIKQLNITNQDECIKLLTKDIDYVIHLAGTPDATAKFNRLLKLNIEGSYNIIDSFYQNGGTRLIVASSAQVNEGYEVDVQTKENDVTAPKNLYGVSKTFLEQLSTYYANQCGMKITALRIGAYDEINNVEGPLNRRDLSAYLDIDDFNHLIDCILQTDQEEPFVLYNTISDNTYKRLNIAKARSELNYQPQADAFKLHDYQFDPQK